MLLLIPGPVTTASEVRQAYAQDYAPWDPDFRALTFQLRSRLLAIAGGNSGTHSTLALQGCGHFAVEAALRTFIPVTGKILVPDTGDYADHMIRLAREAGRHVVTFSVGENQSLNPADIERALRADPDITHVGLVYCETGSGICHDIQAAGAVVRASGRRTIIDAISAFGALPLNVSEMPEADAVIFTSNKCLEGLPGLSFIISPNERLLAAKDCAGSWSLDLADVYLHGLSKPNGTWRFTPVPQAVAALMKALDLYDAEGGRSARLRRYQANQQCYYTGVQELGLKPYLPVHLQGPICVNVHAPDNPAWDLQKFVSALKRRNVVISNFYNTSLPSFRVGCIGAVTPDDMELAVEAIEMALNDIGVRVGRHRSSNNLSIKHESCQ